MPDERVHIIRGVARPYVLVHQPTLDDLGMDGLAAEMRERGIEPHQLGTPKFHDHRHPARRSWTIPITTDEG